MISQQFSSTSEQPWLLTKPVIDHAGLHGSLLLLAPGSDRTCDPARGEQVWFVASGSVTATVGEVNTVLLQDEALHVPAGRSAALRNHGGEPARVLILELPAPRVEYLPIERSQVPV